MTQVKPTYMPRPTSKSELLKFSQTNYQKLIDYIETLTPEEQEAEFKPGTLNRNIRDVLIHIHHWHLLFLGWYEVGMKGEKPDMPAKSYTWKTMPELNLWIQAKYQKTPASEAKALFIESFARVQAVITSHSGDELFTKKKYKWTGSTSLGVYLVSNTSSHYDWALKLIKRGHS